MVRRIFFLNDIGRHQFPVPVFQVLPLVRSVLSHSEPGLVDIAVVAAASPGYAQALARTRVHLLRVEPFVMRHRWIVSVGANRQQKKKTEDHQHATERFHASLHCGLSLTSASANHTNSPASKERTIRRKWNPFSQWLLSFAKHCCFSVLTFPRCGYRGEHPF